MATDINAKDKSKKDAAKYIKKYKDNIEKGMSDEEAMAKAMDFDEDDKDGVDTDGVDKALNEVVDLLKGGAMDKPLVPPEKVDELRKGMSDDFASRIKTLSAENLEVRKSIRELTGAHAQGFDGLCKAFAAQQDVVKSLVAIVTDLKKGGLAAAAVEDKPLAGKPVDDAKGVTVLQTEGDKAAAAAAAAAGTQITADDFINKALNFLEKNPNADQSLRKGLINANTELCSGGDLKSSIERFGDVLGIKA